MPSYISLHKAVKVGDVERVKNIVITGAELSQKNIYGRTPLAMAVQLGRTEIAAILKKSGGRL
jgi:ankyrin repeat protein